MAEDSDFYSDGPDQAAAANSRTEPEPRDREGEEEDEQKQDEGKTALVDSALCPDAEVGKEFMVRVEKKMENELLISYVEHDDHKEGGGEAEPEPAEAGKDKGGNLSSYFD